MLATSHSEALSTSVPADGADVGGHTVRLLRGDGTIITAASRDYDSLDQLLGALYRGGPVPAQLVLALPGCWDYYGDSEDYRLRFTNLPWPSVTEKEVSKAFGCNVVFLNDLQAAALGADVIDRSQLVLLKGGVMRPYRNSTVVANSTGVNWTSSQPGSRSLPLARECGHTLAAIPMGTLSPRRSGSILGQLAMYIAGDSGSSSIEAMLAGPGIDEMIDFISKFYGNKVNGEASRLIAARRKEGKDCAALMTKGVMSESPYWQYIGGIYAQLLGYVLNQIVVGEVAGEVFIQGAVLMGTPGFAQWVFGQQKFQAALHREGGMMTQLPYDVTIYGVPEEVNMAARGARAYAASLLAI